jgi:hypothetical protein
MKKKNIKSTIARAAVYSRTLTRVKHYRGAGVHSPFVYGVIRNAMMKTTPVGDNHPLFDELRARGFSRRRAAQLQNLYTFLGYTSAPFAELAGDPVALDASTLCFVMPSLPDETTEELVSKAEGTGCTLCVISPYGSRSRHKMARALVAAHRHTSVDNRGFLLLFFNPRLPKQHFKL